MECAVHIVAALKPSVRFSVFSLLPLSPSPDPHARTPWPGMGAGTATIVGPPSEAVGPLALPSPCSPCCPFFVGAAGPGMMTFAPRPFPSPSDRTGLFASCRTSWNDKACAESAFPHRAQQGSARRRLVGTEPLTVSSFVLRAPQDEPSGGAPVLDAGHLAVGPTRCWDLPDTPALPVPGGGAHLPRGPAHAELLVSVPCLKGIRRTAGSWACFRKAPLPSLSPHLRHTVGDSGTFRLCVCGEARLAGPRLLTSTYKQVRAHAQPTPSAGGTERKRVGLPSHVPLSTSGSERSCSVVVPSPAGRQSRSTLRSSSPLTRTPNTHSRGHVLLRRQVAVWGADMGGPGEVAKKVFILNHRGNTHFLKFKQ